MQSGRCRCTSNSVTNAYPRCWCICFNSMALPRCIAIYYSKSLAKPTLSVRYLLYFNASVSAVRAARQWPSSRGTCDRNCKMRGRQRRTKSCVRQGVRWGKVRGNEDGEVEGGVCSAFRDTGECLPWVLQIQVACGGGGQSYLAYLRAQVERIQLRC